MKISPLAATLSAGLLCTGLLLRSCPAMAQSDDNQKQGSEPVRFHWSVEFLEGMQAEVLSITEPNNRKLYDKIPSALQDPSKQTKFTPYVVVVGDETVFPVGGAKFDGDESDLQAVFGTRTTKNGVDPSAVGLVDISHGAANTILAGTVDLSTKIPWTKPQDLRFKENLPALGAKNGFAAPYRTPDGSRAGLILLCDGTIWFAPTALSHDTLRDLISRIDPGRSMDASALKLVRTSPKANAVELEIMPSEVGAKARLRKVFNFTLPPRE